MVFFKNFIHRIFNKPKVLNPEIYELVKKGNREALLIYLNYCNDTKSKLDHALFKEGLLTSAKQGNSDSMYDIANFHLTGALTFVQDDRLAMEWFLNSAELGHSNAMNQLAYSYLKGRGVTADNKQMLAWYERAAALGNADAITNIGNIYAQGQGVTKDFAKAYAYFCQAAELGNANAMNNLAYLYSNGLGVEQNQEIAQQWLEKSLAAKATQPITLGALTS